MNTERESLLSLGWEQEMGEGSFIAWAASIGHVFTVGEVVAAWSSMTQEYMEWCGANAPEESDSYVVDTTPYGPSIVHAAAEFTCNRVLFRGTHEECVAFLGQNLLAKDGELSAKSLEPGSLIFALGSQRQGFSQQYQ